MKVLELFDPNDPHHQKMMNNLDHFTASPGLDLKSDTIEFLKTWRRKQSKSGIMALYRVLFTDDIDEMAGDLNVPKLKTGIHVTHKASRVTSWTKSHRVVDELAAENEDLGKFAVILKANIPEKAIVLDTDDLNASDRKHIMLLDQKEVIVEAGAYYAIVIDVIEN